MVESVSTSPPRLGGHRAPQPVHARHIHSPRLPLSLPQTTMYIPFQNIIAGSLALSQTLLGSESPLWLC
jgi:hypothetical protein